MSFIAILDNQTPFEAMHCLLPDGEGGEAVLVVVKASFSIDQGEPSLAEDQVEVRMTEVPRGDPKRGVVLWDGDIVLHKPRVDVLVDGIAYAPGGVATPQFFVELQVGDEIAKSLLISGDRFWDGEHPSPAMPIERMPLSWERAFGGMRSRAQVDERNPVGIGYRGARSADPEVRSELPNIEDPGATLVHPDAGPGESASEPACFGTLGRAWLPRRTLAGTFDEGWKRRRWPLAPRDFDPAFHQSAPPDQQLERYVGGTPVRLVNLTPEGEWLLRLPHIDVPVHLVHGDRCDRAELRLDTVEIEPELRRVVVTGRVALAVEPRRSPLERIVLGHVTPAWLEAKRTGKCYVDLRDPTRNRACFA